MPKKSQIYPLESSIMLTLEGRNLIPPCSVDLSLKIDYKEWEPLGRTEQSMTKIHLFFKKFQIPYNFEAFQLIRLQIISDSDGLVLAERIILLSRILRTHQQKIDLRFMTNLKLSKANQPILSLQAENKGIRSGELSFYFMGKFANISYFIPSIYFTISEPTQERYKSSEDSISGNNYKTKSEILSGYEVIWPEYNLNLPKISGEKDLDKILKVSFFMKNWIFSDTLLGAVNLNILDILEGNRRSYEIHSLNNDLVGKLLISKVKYHKKPSFLDYIFSGLDLNLLIACDFPHLPDSQILLPYESIFEGLHEFINEYDSEKKVSLYGYGLRFYEENGNFFSMNEQVLQERSGSIPSMNSLENISKSYKEMKARLIINHTKEEELRVPFMHDTRFKTNVVKSKVKETHFKIDMSKEEDLPQLERELSSSFGKSLKDEVHSATRPRRSTKKFENFRISNNNRVSFNLGDHQNNTGSIRKSKIVGNSSNLDEMLLEINDYLRNDIKKPRFSKMKYYIIVVLITENIEIEDMQRAFEVAARLSIEMPVFTKFVNLGNINIEKLKGNLSVINKNIGDPLKKLRNKGIGILDMKIINGECEKIMKNVMNKVEIQETEWIELRKTLLRLAIFKGIPKKVVEYFYAENIIPLITKTDSFLE